MAKKKKKQTKKIEKKPRTSHLPKWLPVLTFVALGILIFYPPFFRGLFFDEDMFLYHVFTALVFILIWAQKIYLKDYTLLKTPLDWAIFAYAGAYLLSLIGAVHPGEAFYGFLRVLNYFIVFWMVTQLVKNFRDYMTILQILLAAGTGVAVIGLLAAAGYSDYPTAFDGRSILSTLQYVNTTAAYLAVISLLAITLITVEIKLSIRLIYTIATYLIILVILCTLSKGAWLIFVIGAILLLAVMPGVNKISSLWTLMVAGVAAGAAYTKFYPAIVANQPALTYLLIGVFVVAAGILAWEGLEYLNNNKGYKVTLAIVVILIVVGLSAVSMMLNNSSSPLQAEAIKEELAGLTDFSDFSYTSRADFIRWGIDIVKDHPINGVGAGGWNALYHNYQDYLYFTTEAHNHFIQVWVEAGTIGLLAFLAIWILFLRAAYQTYSRARINGNTDQQILIGGTLTAAVALGLHSAIDFDLSLSAIALVLWILFALVSATENINKLDTPISFKFANWLPVFNVGIAALCGLLLLVYGCSYSSANKHAIVAATTLNAVSDEKSEQEQNELFQIALWHYERATQLNSLDAEYYADLANVYAVIYRSLQESENQLAYMFYEKAVSAIEKAEELKPYNPRIRSSLLNTANILGDFSLMLRQAEGAVQANPLDINAYEALFKVLAAGLEYYYKAGDNEQTTQLAQKIVNTGLKLEEKKAQINSNRPWNGAPLNLSSEAQYSIAQAHYLLGDYAESKAIFKTASPDIFKEVGNENIPQPEIELFAWYAASLYKTGNINEADNIAQQLRTLDIQAYSMYEKLINQEPLQ